MGGGKGQHNGRISSGNTATPPSPGGANIQPVDITRPPTYILTVGFEVNYPNAYVDRVQDLSVDYGHAFFYITKDDVVTVFLVLVQMGQLHQVNLQMNIQGKGQAILVMV